MRIKEKMNHVRKIAPIAATAGVLFMLSTGATYAANNKIVSPPVATASVAATPVAHIVKFIHDVGKKNVIMNSISFEGGPDLWPTEKGTFQHEFFASYDKKLDQYLGMNLYPKLKLGNVNIDDGVVNMKNKEKQLFYISAHIGGFWDEDLGRGGEKEGRLTAYHNLKQKIVLEGSTSQDVHKTVSISGTPASYIKFNNANNGVYSSYMIWQQGNWTLLLNSGTYTEKELTDVAQQVKDQMIKDNVK